MEWGLKTNTASPVLPFSLEDPSLFLESHYLPQRRLDPILRCSFLTLTLAPTLIYSHARCHTMACSYHQDQSKRQKWK